MIARLTTWTSDSELVLPFVTDDIESEKKVIE